MNHGVYVTQNATSIDAPTLAQTGIPFVIGTAPLSGDNAATAGEPVLCASWDDAESALGYNTDWSKYTLCEFMYSHFRLFAMQPVIFLPVAASEEDTATTASVAAAVEKVDLCMGKFGIVPDLICAPGFSDNATVSAAMEAKASSINGMFRAKSVADIAGATYTAAVEAKNGGKFGKETIVCWPMVTVDSLKFHLSTIIAGRICATDADNDGIPYESPSNKAIPVDGLVNSDGTEIMLTPAAANVLNGAGIVTALNFMGSVVAWGNYTGAFPTEKDVKDIFIPVSRMFDWVGNTLIKTFWTNVDDPMNWRLRDTVLDTCNIWLNGLVGGGYLLGARVEFREDENPQADLMNGIVKFHLYLTPPTPAQEIDFVLEYDATYAAAALEA